MCFDDDTRLMVRVSKSDEEAYTELYHKYFSAVEAFARKSSGQGQSSENIAQEVFARVWQQRRKYHPDASLKTYLFGITRNVVREYWRKSQRGTMGASPVPGAPEDSDPAAVLQSKEAVESLALVKSRLSGRQQQAVEFVFYADLPVAEAARRAGCSRGTFRQRVYDAKQRLLVLLRQSHGPDHRPGQDESS